MKWKSLYIHTHTHEYMCVFGYVHAYREAYIYTIGSDQSEQWVQGTAALLDQLCKERIHCIQ